MVRTRGHSVLNSPFTSVHVVFRPAFSFDHHSSAKLSGSSTNPKVNILSVSVAFERQSHTPGLSSSESSGKKDKFRGTVCVWFAIVVIMFGKGVCVYGGVLCVKVVGVVWLSKRVRVSEFDLRSDWSAFSVCVIGSVLRHCVYQMCGCWACMFTLCSRVICSVTNLS